MNKTPLTEKAVLIVPFPQKGGGPGNAMSRVAQHLQNRGVFVTSNMVSRWNVALLNVGTGIRLDIIRLLRLSRRLVYRVDGCYSQLIFERQGRPWDAEYERINKRITLALRMADFVIYQSEFSKVLLDELHQRSPGTWAVVPNGIDLNVFLPTDNVRSVLPVLGCIGTFRANRVRHLLDIVSRVPFEHRLLLVGRMDDQCKRDLTEFSNQTAPHCTLDVRPPVVNDHQLIKLYQELDCFVHPIIGDTCSNAVIEALACGVPVIIPAWSGSSQLVGDGGIIIQQNPWQDYNIFTQACADAFANILKQRADYAHKARIQAVSQFDIKKTANVYYDALMR